MQSALKAMASRTFKPVPSALTFDLVAQCLVCYRKYTAFGGRGLDDESPRSGIEASPWSGADATIYACCCKNYKAMR